MINAVPKEHIIPPGGFHFMQGTHRIEGHSYQSLADAVLRYRMNNKLPIGNPLREVFDFVCDQHPHFCTAPQPLTVSATHTSLATQVAEWISLVYQNSLLRDPETLFVPPEEAARRAAICAECPMNVDPRQGCGSCREAARQIGFTLRAGRSTPQDSALSACSVTGQDNSTAVWLAGPPTLTPSAASELPGHCWRTV